MLISYRWLAEWVPGLPAPGDLAGLLTARGLMVESVQPQARFSGVVVGKVVEREKHPNADRLSLCKVDVGGQVLEIVCGAPNARAGITVAVAVDGARLPGGVLKKSKIRGVVSNGMLCSARELELAEEHEGILELDAALAAGRDFAEASGMDDTILDVELPFNRGDLLSVRGIAREVAAATGRPMKAPYENAALPEGAVPGIAGVDIEDLNDCPRYTCRVVEGVQVGPSPPELARRVSALGMRSINNVVDATNAVLLELGQPIHAFDLATLKGDRISVRRARPGEKLRTLDGVDRDLAESALVIADSGGPVALAGLMGGESTEVRAGTTRVLLESACFGGPRVRQGSKALGLASEASRRFERGTDPTAAREALDRVAWLLAVHASGTARGGALDAWPGRAEPRRLKLRPARVRAVYGVEVAEAEILGALGSLGFKAGASGSAPLDVELPAWRADVLEEIDLVEEVARSRGYDAIPEDAGSVTPLFSRVGEPERFRTQLRETLLGLGFFEAMTPALLGPEDLPLALGTDTAELDSPVKLANPMSRESSLLRPSLLPGLLRALSRNVRHGRADVALYEIGRTFRKSAGALPDESLEVAVVLCGARHAGGAGLGADAVDFQDMKGRLEALLGALHVDNPTFVAYDARNFHPGHAAEIHSGASRLGRIGQVGAEGLKRLEIGLPVFVATFGVQSLQDASRPAGAFRDWSRFPRVKRDLAFATPVEVESAALLNTIREGAGPLLVSARLFDVYSGERIGKGQKSLAFSLAFQSPERTLADAEVDASVEAAVRLVELRHGAKLRS